LDGLLAGFSVDVLAYAVMSNHLHLVLRPRPDRIAGWQAGRVARVGLGLMPVRGGVGKDPPPQGPDLVARYARQPKWVAEYRERLSSVSWLMRLLKQRVATRANVEDNCTGHFWESRFHCIPLLDWSAVLACMVYVDLNPFRAGLAESLDSTTYSSLCAHAGFEPCGVDATLERHLVPLSRCRPYDSRTQGIPRGRLGSEDYQALVRRAAGMATRADRERLSRIGTRLGYDWDHWDVRMAQPGLFRGACVGSPSSMERHAATLGRKWMADKVKIWAKG